MNISREITVVDQTIREGMQFRGLVFSIPERKMILDFQEKLKVNISQAGYPPAHRSEEKAIEELSKHIVRKGYNIRVAGLCRSIVQDVEFMVKVNVHDFHLHSIITEDALKKRDPIEIFKSLKETIEYIRSNTEKSCIGISLLDIGKTEPCLLSDSAQFLSSDLMVDIISLPDTSGILSPDIIEEKVKSIAKVVENKTKLGIHCHNDMGFASANTIMGVLNGGSIIEVSALGIGERNGIGDLFTVGKVLKEKGFKIDLSIENKELFREYYEYVNEICFKKTGFSILNYNTPFFGSSSKTHVAGTHGDNSFGLSEDEEFYVNVLCGKNLVKKVLKRNGIDFDKEDLKRVIKDIKDMSALKERPLSINEIKNIV
ncbi:MAG: hypothetical protein GY714_17800 [Desulfobacterales bacterium]|nr:hypothetical protein [Desulfobacterales bacterium]